MTADEIINSRLLESKIKEVEELKAENARLKSELEKMREWICNTQLRIRKLSKLISEGIEEAPDEQD